MAESCPTCGRCFPDKRQGRSQPVVVLGVEHPSIRAAASAHAVPVQTVKHRMYVNGWTCERAILDGSPRRRGGQPGSRRDRIVIDFAAGARWERIGEVLDAWRAARRQEAAE